MSDNHIKQRIDLLEKHLRDISKKTTAESVTDTSFYSYRHANRLFKSLKGESITSFSNKIRIQTAAEYLKYTSKNILEIALEVGYESTAAFSKAFKKLYEQTPSDFRQTHSLEHLAENIDTPFFKLVYFDKLEVNLFKTAFEQDSTFESFFQNTKTVFSQLNTNAKEWMLLWGEDPELSKVAETRYFIGIHANEMIGSENIFEKESIQGRYALFESTLLTAFPYEVWHEIACVLLEFEGKQLRDDAYIEWFSITALQNPSVFYPYKIGVPIQ